MKYGPWHSPHVLCSHLDCFQGGCSCGHDGRQGFHGRKGPVGWRGVGCHWSQGLASSQMLVREIMFATPPWTKSCGQRPGCRTREGAGIGTVSRMQNRERTVLPCPWTHCERLAACIFPGSRHSPFQENISQEESGRSAGHCLVNWLKSLRSTMEYLLMSATLINLIIFAVNYIILTKMI